MVMDVVCSRKLGFRILLAFLMAVAWTTASAQVKAAPVPGPSPSPSGAGASGTNFDERLRRVQERRRQIERDIERFRGQERGLLKEVESLELEVRLRGEELREVQIEMGRTNARLDATTQRLRELEASVARTRPLVAARARSLYKLGRLSYVRLLLSIEKPAAFLQGYRYITALARRDNERMAAFRRDLEDLGRTREELTRRTREAQALRSEIERRRRRLNDERGRKETFLMELVARKETQAAFLDELRTAEERLRELLSGLREGEVSVPIIALRGALPWPVTGRVRSHVGRRKHPRFDTYTVQNGIEIEAQLDAPVSAVHEGTVAYADRFLGYGLMVVIDHGDRHLSLYAHLGESAVTLGQRVTAGETIGTVGSGLDEPGLYFEFRSNGKPEDPMDWLRKPPL